MKSLFTLVFTLTVCAIYGQTYIGTGEQVSGRWTLEGSPYYINGVVFVDHNSSLTIDPGVVVKLRPGLTTQYAKHNFKSGVIRVKGKLTALGTSKLPITFTKADGQGRWGMLLIDKGASGKFNHCVIEYGQSIVGIITPKQRVSGALTYYNASGYIKNSVVRNNAHTGILCYKSSNVQVLNNSIVSNLRGIDIHELSTPKVTRNVIVRSKAVGIDLDTHSDYTLTSNTLCYNTIGIRKPDENNAKIRIINTIFFCNESNFRGPISKKDMLYSLITNGNESLSNPRIESTNLLGIDPRFVDSKANNFNIKISSPCRNAGSPIHFKLSENTISGLVNIPTKLIKRSSKAYSSAQIVLGTYRLKNHYLDSLRTIVGVAYNKADFMRIITRKLGSIASKKITDVNVDLNVRDHILKVASVRNIIGAGQVQSSKSKHSFVTNHNSYASLLNDAQQLENLANDLSNSNNLESAIVNYKKALEIRQKLLKKTTGLNRLELRKTIASTQAKLGTAYFYVGSHDKALNNYEKILEETDVLDKATTGRILSNMGFVYEDMGRYDKAVSYFERVETIQRKQKNWREVARSKFKVGDINYKSGAYKKSLTKFNDALKIENKHALEDEKGASFNNIGAVYSELLDTDNATQFLRKAIKQHLKQNDTLGLSITYNNMANIALENKKTEKAFKLYGKSIAIKERSGNTKGLAISYHNLANVYLHQKNTKKAKEYYQKSNDVAQKVGLTEISIRNYSALSKLSNANNECDDMIKTLLDYAEDQLLFSEDAMKQIAEFQSKFNEESSSSTSLSDMETLNLDHTREITHVSVYKREIARHKRMSLLETAQRQKQIKLLSAKLRLSRTETHANEVALQRLYIIMASLLIIIIIIAYAFYRLSLANKENKRINQELMNKNTKIRQQNEEIEVQSTSIVRQNTVLLDRNEKIIAQRNQIEHSNQQLQLQAKDISDSIYYARRIQRAIMPSDQLLQGTFHDHFVFFRPRDIVSGDFYWLKTINNYTVFAAADCTGHGVPGAFMSILGISLLNEIVNKDQRDSAANILNSLRNKVKEALNQTGKEGEQTDGMDISLLVLDHTTNEIQFSGAYNPLLLVRKNELTQVKADRQPIGIHPCETDFTNHQISTQKGDMLYMFSDGFMDQIGGSRQKKYMSKHLKQFLITISNETLEQQNILLATELDTWKQDLEQVDDVLVVGIRFD